MTSEWREQFTEALRRQSMMMLDNLGISVDMSKLPSSPERQQAYIDLYGVGRWGRLRKRLEHWLRPGLKRVREQRTYELEQRIKREFMAHVLEQGERMMEQISDD